MSLKKILRYVGKRAKEPTTWGGLALLGGLLGGPGVAAAVGKVGSLVIGVTAGGLMAHQQEETS